jgi:hypothetical protein
LQTTNSKQQPLRTTTSGRQDATAKPTTATATATTTMAEFTKEEDSVVEQQTGLIQANNPEDVLYCGVCSMPPEFCEFGTCYDRCLPWILDNCPEVAGGEAAVIKSLKKMGITDTLTADELAAVEGEAADEDEADAAEVMVFSLSLSRSPSVYVCVCVVFVSIGDVVRFQTQTFWILSFENQAATQTRKVLQL